MWNLSVPKILHCYWGGERLPYIRYLTMKSFIRQNPDWEVWLWMPTEITKEVTWQSKENDYALACTNFLPMLLALPVKKIYVDFRDTPMGSDSAEVHRADYIRIFCLYQYGGAWSDSDIIYFKPIDSLVCNTKENATKNVFVTICEYGHSTGFLMATKNSFFYRVLNEKVVIEFNRTHYQCIGPIMFNKYFRNTISIPGVVNISMDATYRYRFAVVEELLSNKTATFNHQSIGCHWYGGNTIWEPFIRLTNGGLTNIPPSIIGNLLKPYKYE